MYVASYQEYAERERARAHQSRQRAGAVPAHRWQPYADVDAPHPQRMAIESDADLIGYGGEAGGGKTDVLLGIAERQHRSIIFRRIFPSVRGIIERSREIFSGAMESRSTDSFNEQLHLWRLRGGQTIEFAAMQFEKDKEKYRGRPHDFYGFDELTEFSESQFRFVTAWNRSTRIDPLTGKPQRCRVVVTFNPPMDESGDWVVRLFLPWLAYQHPETYQHPHPAQPGELRWYAMIDGEECEVGPGPFEHKGEMIQPKSRTFIPASLKDNPALLEAGYGATIDALPEPLRSLLKGQFGAARVANPWQVIPTAWVRLAQTRWRERRQPAGLPQATGMDVARGGKAQTVLAHFYANYCAALDKHAGAATPDGPSAAALALPYAGGLAGIYVDIIGVGGSAFDSLKANGVHVTGVNFAESAAGLRDRSGKLGFYNVRAAAYWLFREALDPDHGDDLALPDDPELLADLCAPTWRLTTRGVLIESKEDIAERLGRSPDCGDAVVLAHWGATQGGYEPGI
jgi:hypothetical protein